MNTTGRVHSFSTRGGDQLGDAWAEFLGDQLGRVADAAERFEQRWTWKALKRVNPELHDKLWEQRDWFRESILKETQDDIERHGASLCRGYQVAIEALEKAQEPDDAYILGLDSGSGLKLAIGQQKAACERAVELYGENTIWITPDELASLIALAIRNDADIAAIIGVKQRYPGAEITNISTGVGNGKVLSAESATQADQPASGGE